MLSQAFCYWDKKQSTDSNVIQFHHTLKCTKNKYSHFGDCFLVSKWILQHHDRVLTKFHVGSEQTLMCVVINNSSYPAVKNNNTAYYAFRKYWMQARGFLTYHLKYCWPKVICCSLYVNQMNLIGKLRKNLRGQPQTWGGMAHPAPAPPLRIVSATDQQTSHGNVVCKCSALIPSYKS